jgi:hypothetical protein
MRAMSRMPFLLGPFPTYRANKPVLELAGLVGQSIRVDMEYIFESALCVNVTTPRVRMSL